MPGLPCGPGSAVVVDDTSTVAAEHQAVELFARTPLDLTRSAWSRNGDGVDTVTQSVPRLTIALPTPQGRREDTFWPLGVVGFRIRVDSTPGGLARHVKPFDSQTTSFRDGCELRRVTNGSREALDE